MNYFSFFSSNTELSISKTIADAPDDSFDDECDFYIAPSVNPDLGRGVIAGRSFKKGVSIFEAVTLPVVHSRLTETQLLNYVYASNEDDISIAEFGLAMLFNHREIPSVDNHWAEYEVKDFKKLFDAHSTFTTIEYNTAIDIEVGDEVFASYGNGSEWFSMREIPYFELDSTPANREQDSRINSELISQSQPKRSLDELKSVGHCITHVEVDTSYLPMAGKGLYAGRNFEQGEVVTVSPVLLLSKKIVEAMSRKSNSVLMNYCIASPESSVVMFPIGLSILANHGRSEIVNIIPELYFWGANATEVEKKKNTSLVELSMRPFAQLDIAFRAKRDILKGEELYFSYGEDWLNSWATYLAELFVWYEDEARGEIEDDKEKFQVQRPLFRSYIGDSYGLFLKQWNDLNKVAVDTDINGETIII